MPEVPDLPPELLNQLAALALNPQLGEVFVIAGREFKRAFLRLDSEEQLVRLIVELLEHAGGAEDLDLARLFMDALPSLRQAGAIVLADLADESPDAMLVWLTTTRGVRHDDLIQAVIAQVQLQELGPVLGKLLLGSALFGALVKMSHPSTSPAPGSSDGPGSGPASPPP